MDVFTRRLNNFEDSRCAPRSWVYYKTRVGIIHPSYKTALKSKTGSSRQRTKMMKNREGVVRREDKRETRREERRGVVEERERRREAKRGEEREKKVKSALGCSIIFISS